MDWNGKRVVIIGAARQGTALAAYLVRHGADATITDQKTAEQLQDSITDFAGLSIRWQLGGSPIELLDACDLLCPSGGVPLELPIVVEARQRGIPLSNDSQIFLEAAPCKVIGITGSAGKTTTTTLVGRMAEAATQQSSSFRRSFVGGNIGNPLITSVDEMTAYDLAVMELSSFQLDIMTRSPHVAAITNITPNHLDRHGTMAAYTAAKANILHFQQSDQIAVLNREDPGAWSLAPQVRGRLVSFGIQRQSVTVSTESGTYHQDGQIYWLDQGIEQALFPTDLIELRGEHNLQNVLAACAISIAAGLPFEALQAGVAGFMGVPHRLEKVRNRNGVDWYNDSIATTPERAMADINSFDENLIVLIGGRDKHLPWDDFAALTRHKGTRLILFGEMADLVQRALNQAGSGSCILKVCNSLEEAVQSAAEHAQSGDVVLLSPGGTSFDQYQDFEARGEAFRQFVQKLK